MHLSGFLWHSGHCWSLAAEANTGGSGGGNHIFIGLIDWRHAKYGVYLPIQVLVPIPLNADMFILVIAGFIIRYAIY